jgi:hypothetical protein
MLWADRFIGLGGVGECPEFFGLWLDLLVINQLVHWVVFTTILPEDGRLTSETCRGLRHNKMFVIIKVKVY